jgi:hypothetical protein
MPFFVNVNRAHSSDKEIASKLGKRFVGSTAVSSMINVPEGFVQSDNIRA